MPGSDTHHRPPHWLRMPCSPRPQPSRGLQPTRYRLDVVATDIVDVVAHIGGWLCDRSLAGWEVTVLVVDGADARPARILGAELLDLEPIMKARGDGRLPHTVAVAADLCAQDPRTRRALTRALRHQGTEVVVWGDGWPAGRRHGVNSVLHQLSDAARMFKTQALIAAAPSPRTPAPAPTEVFRSNLTGGV